MIWEWEKVAAGRVVYPTAGQLALKPGELLPTVPGASLGPPPPAPKVRPPMQLVSNPAEARAINQQRTLSYLREQARTFTPGQPKALTEPPGAMRISMPAYKAESVPGAAH